MEKKPLIILSGPTAVGKTSLSVRLAAAIGGEIVSADSMQVYRYMDIGSAKATPEERAGIPHHLLDVLDPEEDFNVVRFQTLAKKAVEEIHAKGKIPLIVGGTGFYIQALLYDIDFTENNGDMSYRNMLERKAASGGGEELYRKLQECDPRAAEQIHPHNIKRVIRALEFHHQTGARISDHNDEERQKKSPYHSVYFVLTDERSLLYERIDRRVDRMMETGLVDEVKRLRARGVPKDAISMQGLGYKELYAYLDGAYPLEEAVRIIKRDTRHFAKRQLTWFRRERDVVWIDRSAFDQDEQKILEEMIRVVRQNGLIRTEGMEQN